jgi:tetratricopeptide (TPR) repeat protein
MDAIDSRRFWEYMQEGRWEVAYQALTIAITTEPQTAPHYANRGTCLLAMRRRDEALADFEKALELLPKVQGCPVKAGVVLWWQKRHLQAVEMWRRGLRAEYRDAAGGVEVSALLFFAATRLDDVKLEKEAWGILLNLWKPRLAHVWPGPVAGYLLGRMDESTFLVNQTFSDPILEARRLTKAFFWVGLKRYREGNKQEYFFRLKQSTEQDTPQHRSVILEAEYWLALAELELKDAA